MSYDLNLVHPVTGDVLELDAPHQMKGGTYAIGGCSTASLNVTYNYAPHFHRVLPATETRESGIRGIYGLTGAESIPILKAGIAQLKDDVAQDYWASTEGNAKAALSQLLAMAQLRPDGVWKGD